MHITYLNIIQYRNSTLYCVHNTFAAIVRDGHEASSLATRLASLASWRASETRHSCTRHEASECYVPLTRERASEGP